MFIQETDPVCDDTPSLSKEAENVYPVVNPAGRVQNNDFIDAQASINVPSTEK